MCPMQSPQAEKEIHALLPKNPVVPPTGDTCYINNLPPELLSRVFEIGVLKDGSEEEEGEEEEENGDGDDDGVADSRLQGPPEEEYKRRADADVEMADDKNADGADQELEEEVADQEEDKEGDDEEWTDVPGSSDFDSSPSPSFQIVISLVCRHWRDVALSTPSIWTTIKVPSNARSPYENVSILLERSKALPIDISIDDPELDDHGSVNVPPQLQLDLKSLYSLLVPHVQRWRSINVWTLSYHSIYEFLSAVSVPSVPAASQLATVELYHNTDADAEGIQPKLSNHFTLFGGSAPNLTTLFLRQVHVDWNQGWIASASNLRYLKLACHEEDVRPTWAQFATILRGAPQLETLVLYGSGPSGDPTEWFFEPTPGRPTGDLNAPIQLLKLTDFVLAFQSPSCAIGLLRKCYMPSLKSLTLDFEEDDYTDLINQLAGPATSLSPLSAQEQLRSLLSSLEKLKIAGLPCRSTGVETLYSELQNLQSLYFSPPYLLPQFIDLLCRPCMLPGRGDIWLPRLKSLWISDTTRAMIRRVVQNRKDAGVPLKALYVQRNCVNDDDVEWLKENVETFDFFLEDVSEEAY